MSFLQGNTSKSGLLDDILSKCEDNTGKYVNQGTYGIGFMFSISKEKESPITLMTLDNRVETGSEMDCQVRNFFVKIVPLYSKPNYEDLLKYSTHKKWTTTSLIYIDKSENIKYGRPVDKIISNNGINLSIKNGRQIVRVNLEDILGYSWKIAGKERDIRASPAVFFENECKIQVEMYKATNHNLDSFIPPIYISDIIDKNDTNIVDLLQRKFDSSVKIAPFYDFFVEMKNKMKVRYSAKFGIIVMPCMPMPPIVTGINIFHVLITNRQSMTSYFKLEKIANKKGDNYELLEYHEIPRPNDKKYLYFFVQIVCGMIDLLNNGYIHGDLHLGNTLINIKQIASTKCFDVDSNGNYVFNSSSPFMGKVFLIDYGTAKKVDISSFSHLNGIDLFKAQIEMLLKTKGTHGFSPLDFYVYDWLPSLFLSRKNGKYNNSIYEKNLRTMFDLVNEFREKREEYQKMIIGAMQDTPSFVDILGKIRESNEYKMNSSVLERPPVVEEDEYSMVVGGRDSILTLPTVDRKIESSLRKEKLSIKSSSIKSSPKSRENMNEALAKSIFAIDPSVIENAGNKMIENLAQGVESVENLNKYIESVKSKSITSRSPRKRTTKKKGKHKKRRASSKSRSRSKSRS
jgi:hypothetical protein